MKFQSKLKLVAAFVTGIAAVGSVHAADATINASVTVNNTIDLTVVAPLDFGTIAAFGNSNTTLSAATLVIPADPAAAAVTTDDASGDARIIVLTPGAPADISVVGAAPNTLLTVAVTAADPALSDPAGIATDGFTMSGFTKYAYLEGNNQTFGSTTDATGALGMNIGATLSTIAMAGGAASDATVAYGDATFTGVIEVAVNY